MNCKLTALKPFGVCLEPKHNNIHVNDLDIQALKKLFCQKQLLVLRGFNTFQHTDDYADYCGRWGEISIWPFGKVLELIEQEEPKDHIFDNNYVPLHWDGMYRPQVPEYQIFHCVNAPLSGQGGKTTFSNTLLALKHAPSEAIKLWQKVTGTYQRKMDFYNSKTVSPVICQHPYKNLTIIRYNEPPSADKGHFVNPPELQFTGISPETLDNFHISLKKALYDPMNFYAHEWQTGDVIIADNFSLLHGREPFVSKSPRHIQRVHVLSDPPFDNPALKAYE